MRCPNCSSKERLYRSRFRGLEIFLLLLLRRPYRCGLCQTRFVEFRRSRRTPVQRRRTAAWISKQAPLAREFTLPPAYRPLLWTMYRSWCAAAPARLELKILWCALPLALLLWGLAELLIWLRWKW